MGQAIVPAGRLSSRPGRLKGGLQPGLAAPQKLVVRNSYSEANLTVVLETAVVLPCFAVARMS